MSTLFELTLCRLVGIKDSHTKTTGSHMALHACNSDAKSGRELFKASKIWQVL